MCGEVTKNKVNDVLKVSWIYFFFFQIIFFFWISMYLCDPNISGLIYELLWSVLWKSPLKLKKNWNHNFVQFFPLKFSYFLDRNFNAYFLTVSAVNILGVTAWKPFLFRVRFGWLHVGLRVEETKSGS